MNRSSFQKISDHGFTLVELVVSITIGAIIIAGLSFFISQVNSDILTAKNRTMIHTDMTTFIEKMNFVRANYSSGIILVDTPSGYDTLLFTNTGTTSGVLVGVVNADLMDGSGNTKLDPVSDFQIYGNKVIAMQELTGPQAKDLLDSTASAYDIGFWTDKLFGALHTETFSVVVYNSGSLFEIDTDVYEKHTPALRGSPTSLLSETVLSFNLVF